MEIRDCHFCNYGCCDSPSSDCVYCYVDDGCYFDHEVKDSKKEAEECECFEFCETFPKF